MFLPMAWVGTVSSTERSCAARVARASRLTSTPGASAPPRNCPSGPMASTFVDVPKSTTTTGRPRPSGQRPNSSWAASAVTTRSEPTSRGLSTCSGTPVRTPGPMRTTGTSRESSSSRSAGSSAGTVEHADTPVISASRRSPRHSSRSSSAVARGDVVTRQQPTRLSPSKVARTVWLLPTSTVSSTAQRSTTSPRRWPCTPGDGAAGSPPSSTMRLAPSTWTTRGR